MTSPTPLADAVLEQARARARDGAWHEVAALLGAHPGAAVERPERGTLYAEALLRAGAPQRAQRYLRETLPLVEHGPHRAAHRAMLNLLGAASFAVGSLDEASAAWDRALELAHESEDALLVARTTNNLGALANLRGAAHDALHMYQLAIPVYQRLGELRGLAETFHNLAITYRDLGELARADEHEQRAIEHARDAGASQLEVMARVGRADIALRRGDPPLAAVTALAAAAAPHADPGTRADALRLAGESYAAMGRLVDARPLLDEALALSESARQALIHAEALLASARLAWREGAATRARSEGARALEAFERLGSPRDRERARELAAEMER